MLWQCKWQAQIANLNTVLQPSCNTVLESYCNQLLLFMGTEYGIEEAHDSNYLKQIVFNFTKLLKV